MIAPENFQSAQTKRKPMQRSGRHKAQQLIDSVQSLIPEQFRNIRDTEPISRYVGATRASCQDVVMAGHESRLDDHAQRLAVIEARLGLRKPMGSARGLALVRRSA